MSEKSLKEAFGLEGGGIISLVGAGGKTGLMFSLAHEFADEGCHVLTTTTTKIFVPSEDQSDKLILMKSRKEMISRAEILLENTRHITAAAGYAQGYENKLAGFAAGDIDDIRIEGPFRWIIVEADGAGRKPLKAPAPHEPVIPEKSGWVIGVCGLSVIGRPLKDDWVFRPEIFSRISGLPLGEPVTEHSIVTSIEHPEGIFKGAPLSAKKILFLNIKDQTRLIEPGRLVADSLMRNKHPVITSVIIGRAIDRPHVEEVFEA